MKKSLSLLPLMVALAAGAAGATGTTAGTAITNTATINFSDDTGAVQPAVNSNTVSTTVLPVPSFTITPNQTTTGTAPTDAPDYTKPGQAKTAKPGDIVAFPYTLTNTGNVASESYDLTTGTTATNGVGGTGTGLAQTSVKYYTTNPDANADGTITAAELAAATAVTTISGVAKDAAVTLYQVYTIPTTATDAQTYGSSPTGTRRANGAAGSANEPATPFTQPTDSNNANLTTVQRTDAVAIGPKTYPDGNAPAATTYASVDATPVTVTESGDTQTAPSTSTTTKITYTNTVRNPGNRPDVFDITAVTANLPTGASYRLLDATGAVLTDTDGDGVPDIGTLAAGGTRDIRVEVTLAAGSTTAAFNTQPTFTITATSGNDATKKDTTLDTVLLPGVAFGDKTATDPAPATVVNQNGAAPTAGGNPTTSTTNILTGIPMQIKNNGGTAETFTPAGTITFSTPNGNVTKTVSYLPDANCDGVADSAAAITVTPAVAPGASYCLIPVVDLPDNTYPGAYTLTQSATGNTSGVKATDSNDTVTVPKIGTPANYVSKTVDKASAKPGDTLTYTITAIDKANSNLKGVVVSDFLPTNTGFVSIAAVTTVVAPGKVMYRVGGTGTWSATAPTALAAATKVEVAVDSNNDNTIDTSDILKPGEKFDVTFKVTVN
ncbi:hypothetical protein [Deinococcus sp.]|uniref:DUF11 domain-containing protein n=1 Tax=Deinococcus sp. TaxID=47478 RepID=UPI003C7BCEDE